ncbi:hypothetical protein [Limosilactobacillus reuteri]|jgi:NADH:ubiquinone oxidoreductase subunit D|uniref:hypothetical protein n=1 Tax=Limosilactobacillus reuteri TaxID=1598 RepID=UPI002B05F1CA|nr:hypothetical protein [Limosilactobacillus reuteri]
MVRYNDRASFEHDFFDTTMKSTPYSKSTTTYQRAMKRQDRRIIEEIARSHTPERDARERARRLAQDKDDRANGDLFSRVARRIQKQNPGMSWIKARKYARTKDPTGRAIFNMMSAGSSNKEIRDKLHLGKKGSKPSTGKMGH